MAVGATRQLGTTEAKSQNIIKIANLRRWRGTEGLPIENAWILRKFANCSEGKALRTSQPAWNVGDFFYKPINMIIYDRLQRLVSLCQKLWPLE